MRPEPALLRKADSDRFSTTKVGLTIFGDLGIGSRIDKSDEGVDLAEGDDHVAGDVVFRRHPRCVIRNVGASAGTKNSTDGYGVADPTGASIRI